MERTSGRELTRSMKEQAEVFGAELLMAEVLDMELEQDGHGSQSQEAGL